MSPARRRGQDAAPNRRNDLDRVEHRHTINTGGTAAKPTTNIKINNNSYTENLTSSSRANKIAYALVRDQCGYDPARWA
jgi:TATA-box binding protein (TBP) (component of TFIID and TFIIIB)